MSLNGPEEEEQPQTVQEFLELALLKIQGKLNKDGLALLIQALKMERERVGKFIEQRFEKCLEKKDVEQALTWGNALFRVQGENALLANKLGNCARHLDKYTLANNFYRHGLKQKEHTELLRHSLAASLAKTERYDADIGRALGMYKSFESPYFPSYTTAGKVIARLAGEQEDADFEKNYAKIKLVFADAQVPEDDAVIDDELAEKLYNIALFEVRSGKSIMAVDILNRLSKDLKNFNGLHILGLFADFYANDTPLTDMIERVKEAFIKLPKNRYLAVNLGLLYGEASNWLQEYKFLLTATDLLEASQGLFGIQEQIQVAEKQYQAGHLEESVAFFKVVAEQEENIHVLSRLGEIYFSLENYPEALDAYIKIKENFSEFEVAKTLLEEVWKRFMDQGSEERGKGKTALSAQLYQGANKLKESAEAYKALGQIFHQLQDKNEAYNNEQKFMILQKEEEEAERMAHRDKLIKLGKAMISQKKFNEGLDHLKQAFQMKKDKDLFMLQAYLLKSLKRPKALAELLSSWKAPKEEETA
ncbi:MAG: hypothetical protein QNL04_13515 [SAR324 cluster bacterium]|nr:hypothetical protein [SAR324 cluster bacterium]